MTREEAIKILQGAIKKPNTKDGYLGQALDMAIKELEQEPFINKTCVSEKQCEHDKNVVLDKIRAEIVDLGRRTMNDNRASGIWACRDIIDKYKVAKGE